MLQPNTEQLTPTIVRYSPPGKMDTLPKDSVCQVISEEHKGFYIQRSPDEEKPFWEKI